MNRFCPTVALFALTVFASSSSYAEITINEIMAKNGSSLATASGVKEIDWVFTPGLLHEGENTIAVEVHQCNATSTDAWWRLVLSYPSATSATGGLEVPQTGLKLKSRVRTSGGEWSALCEIGINAVVPQFFTDDYEEQIYLGKDGSFSLSNANFKAGLVIADGVTAKLNAAAGIRPVRSVR